MRLWMLVTLGLLLTIVGVGGMVVTADLPPCWPNCQAQP